MMSTPTPQNLQDQLSKFTDDQSGLLVNLWARWQEEKEYEDIKDYAKPFEGSFPANMKLVKMTKRPFGLEVTLDEMPGAVYSVYCDRRGTGWKRVK